MKNAIGIILLLFTVLMYWIQINADFRGGTIYVVIGFLSFAFWVFYRVTGRI